MNTRYDIWTGGEYYWIDFHDDAHRVRKASPDWSNAPNETIFTGNFEDCKKWVDDEVCRNYEYDHDI
jgi:hypothetical protein